MIWWLFVPCVVLLVGVIVHQDLTRQKRRAEELAEFEARYALGDPEVVALVHGARSRQMRRFERRMRASIESMREAMEKQQAEAFSRTAQSLRNFIGGPTNKR